MAISNSAMFRQCYGSKEMNFHNLVKLYAVACGFGKQGVCEPLYDKEGMAGYLSKLCNELTGGGKGFQIPINAPLNFRRLRASKGLLPKRHKDEELSGILRKFPLPELVQGSLDNTGISGGKRDGFRNDNPDSDSCEDAGIPYPGGLEQGKFEYS
jgi:hypothetical protein